MQKIIDGKRYNTETAEEVCSWGSGGSYSDFGHYSNTLYRTKKGAWFIVGAGGPRSMWAESCGQNSWSGGSGLLVITEDEARKLTELHASTETVERLFAYEDA